MAKVYPSFPCIIDEPSTVMVNADEELVLSERFVLSEKVPSTQKQSLDTAISRLYPNAENEMKFLCCTAPEYREKIRNLMLLWTSKNNMIHRYEVKYIPPGYEQEWKEATARKKPFPEKKYLNVLAINKSLALIAIKIKESDEFHIAFSLINGKIPGFYRSTPLQFPFVAGACLIEDTNAGFIATATEIVHFEVTENSDFKIIARFDNPTYPKKKPTNSAEELEHKYPILLMQATMQYLVVARFGSCPMFIGARSHLFLYTVPIEITSLNLRENEFSCGDSNGLVRTYALHYKKSGRPILKLKKKLSHPLCKVWNCFNQIIEIPPQKVLLQEAVGNYYVYVLEHAMIAFDRKSKTIAVNNNIEPIFSAVVIGDLLITLTNSHTLFFTQVGQSVPLKRTKLTNEEIVGSPGRRLLYANLFGIWILCSSGTLIKVELPTPVLPN